MVINKKKSFYIFVFFIPLQVGTKSFQHFSRIKRLLNTNDTRKDQFSISLVISKYITIEKNCKKHREQVFLEKLNFVWNRFFECDDLLLLSNV